MQKDKQPAWAHNKNKDNKRLGFILPFGENYISKLFDLFAVSVSIVLAIIIGTSFSVN